MNFNVHHKIDLPSAMRRAHAGDTLTLFIHDPLEWVGDEGQKGSPNEAFESATKYAPSGYQVNGSKEYGP